MNHLYATLHTLGAALSERITQARATLADKERREDGVITLEAVFWAAALIVLAGVIVAAFTAFVTGKLGSL